MVVGPQRMQAINELSMDGFKDWLKKGDTTKPFAAQADKYKETGNAEEISGHRAIGTERGQVPKESKRIAAQTFISEAGPKGSPARSQAAKELQVDRPKAKPKSK